VIFIFANLYWKLIEGRKNVVFFELRKRAPKEVDLQARNPQAPIKTLMPKCMRFSWASGTPIKNLIRRAIVEHLLLRLWSISSIDLRRSSETLAN
jgi:hypothetical protein